MGPESKKSVEPNLSDLKRADEKMIQSWDAAKAVNRELVNLHSTKNKKVTFHVGGKLTGNLNELPVEGIASLAKKYPEFLHITDHEERGENKELLGSWADFVFENPEGERIPILSYDTLENGPNARVVVYPLLPNAITGPKDKPSQTVTVTFDKTANLYKIEEEKDRKKEASELKKLEGYLQ